MNLLDEKNFHIIWGGGGGVYPSIWFLEPEMEMLLLGEQNESCEHGIF